MQSKCLEQLKDERGAVIVVVAVLILVLVGFAALAIDIGYTAVNKNELQNVADGAALAASRALGEIYTSITSTTNQQNFVLPDTAALVAAAQQVANNNTVANASITISNADVRVGLWEGETFTPTYDHPNAVNVTVRRDGTVNGPIATFLAGVLGTSSVNVSATATASLLNTLKIPPGGIHFPIGLSKTMFNGSYCGSSFAVYSSSLSNVSDPNAGCAAWTSFFDEGHDAATMRTILTGLANQTYQSPEMIADLTMLNFTNATQGRQTFDKMADLFNAMKNCNNPDLDLDDNPATWTTVAPVYDSGCNPSGWIPISGFATVTITGVTGPPDMMVQGTINCNAVISGASGGVDFGSWGAIPNLVQ